MNDKLSNRDEDMSKRDEYMTLYKNVDFPHDFDIEMELIIPQFSINVDLSSIAESHENSIQTLRERTICNLILATSVFPCLVILFRILYSNLFKYAKSPS